MLVPPRGVEQVVPDRLFHHETMGRGFCLVLDESFPRHLTHFANFSGSTSETTIATNTNAKPAITRKVSVSAPSATENATPNTASSDNSNEADAGGKCACPMFWNNSATTLHAIVR